MLNFAAIPLDQDNAVTANDVSLLTWLAAYLDGDNLFPSTDATEGASLAYGLGLDTEVLDAWLSGTSDAPGLVDNNGNGSLTLGGTSSNLTSSQSSEISSLVQSDLSYDDNGTGPQWTFSGGLHRDIANLDGLDDVPVEPALVTSAPHGDSVVAQDVIVLDTYQFAKGGNAPAGNGNGGGGGGNGGGGGSGDPNAVSSYTSGAEGGYNIQIDFKGTWTADLQDAFIEAADLLSTWIVGDIADVFYRGKVIDDIVITAELKDIDGTGGILGQAGPTAVRTDGYQPAAATMQFDIADAEAYSSAGQWEEIVLHEMMHSVGFGTIWDFLGLVDGSGTNTPTFSGYAATLTYQAEFGAEGADGVPLEDGGGSGTAESHWDEETFDAEVMTGYLNSTTSVSMDVWATDDDLSDMTLASLEDLGYDTLWSPDAYLIA
ncbi:MAG: leishmanolysin-related zinc metalloendopeptidase [Alphaproteobacteria bacterium]|jgi:hypothetical protein